jgi:GAF domain-containing protein
MVNLITDHQYFAGLHVPQPASPGADAAQPEVGRVMDRQHGYCPHVLDRRKALVLDDVCAYPRFASNEVVDLIGIRTYLGAPLIDEETGTTLGTICIVDTEPRPWGREGLEFIRDYRDRLMDEIRKRQAPQQP